MENGDHLRERIRRCALGRRQHGAPAAIRTALSLAFMPQDNIWQCQAPDIAFCHRFWMDGREWQWERKKVGAGWWKRRAGGGRTRKYLLDTKQVRVCIGQRLEKCSHKIISFVMHSIHFIIILQCCAYTAANRIACMPYVRVYWEK